MADRATGDREAAMSAHLPNPFDDSALVSEMRAGSATAPDISDPPVAVAVNPVSVSAECVAIVPHEETPVPVVAVASDSELAGFPVAQPRQTETLATRSLGTGQEHQA